MLYNSDAEQQEELCELDNSYQIALKSIKRNNLFVLIFMFYFFFIIGLTLVLGIVGITGYFSP